MKISIYISRVSDSFKIIIVDTRFIECELQIRAEVFLTMHIAISNDEAYVICFIFFIGAIKL